MLKAQNVKINNICKITYSNDSTNNKILNVRFVLQDNNDDNVKLVMDFIENLIKDYNLNGLNITRGKYKENNVIYVAFIIISMYNSYNIYKLPLLTLIKKSKS